MKTLTVGYTGTVAGYKRFGRKHVLRAAFRGQTVAQAAQTLQPRLDTAQRQSRVYRALGGGVVA